MSSSQSTLPNGLITFGPRANCTLDLCPLEASLLQYQPNVPANGIFIAVFGLLMLVHTWQGVKTRTWGFMSSMIVGCILEIVGYVGRLIIHDNPFNFIWFLLQISESYLYCAGMIVGLTCVVCIGVAPVFFCSAIYVLLSQVYVKPEQRNS